MYWFYRSVTVTRRSWQNAAHCDLLLLQLSEISDIPLENLEFAKVCVLLSTEWLVRFFLTFVNIS